MRWNKVLVSRQKQKIILQVNTLVGAIGIGGKIQLDLRHPVLPCTASLALIK
jgi:hypothetical protein